MTEWKTDIFHTKDFTDLHIMYNVSDDHKHSQ